MKLKIVVAGSNQMNAEEVVDAMQLILGDVVKNVETVLTDAITDIQMADLFVCGKTQSEKLAHYVSSEKMIALDLMPTSQFFVQVARIPAGEDVYVFNSNLRYANRLVKSCKRVGINDVHFIMVGYEEMPKEAVIDALQKAKYIIGVAKLVGKTVLLSQQYAPYLREDLVIIGTNRVASMQSACLLIQWVAAYFHQSIAKQVSMITSKLRSTVVNTKNGDYSKNLAGVANDLDQLLLESNQSMLTMHDAVMKSFANQIAPNITVFDNHTQQVLSVDKENGAVNSSSMEIVKTLENISCLSAKFIQLSEKIDTVK